MRATRFQAVLLVAILLAVGAQPAFAWGPRVFIGVGPLWYPYPYLHPYPYVYPVQPVIIERQPEVYVESRSTPPSQGYWYYCEDPKGYYPYVPECSRPWMQVVPQAPPR